MRSLSLIHIWAAQFSPFAALAGYEAAIREAARLTEPAVELAEDAAAALDEKLRLLTERLAQRPQVTVTWFEPDAKKEGGAFRVLSLIHIFAVSLCFQSTPSRTPAARGGLPI